MPFQTLSGQTVDTIDLRQIAANKFKLITGFRFAPGNGAQPVIVPVGAETDLASVPTFLWWFVASHGRHTLPAVMHDHLVVDDMSLEARTGADALFLEALADRRIGWWRRRIIWAAVTFATLKSCALPLFVLAVAQTLAGIAVISMPLWMEDPSLPWLDLELLWWHLALLPVACAALWGSRGVAVALATYIGPFLAPASISVVMTILIASVPNMVRWIVRRLPADQPIIVKPTANLPWP